MINGEQAPLRSLGAARREEDHRQVVRPCTGGRYGPAWLLIRQRLPLEPVGGDVGAHTGDVPQVRHGPGVDLLDTLGDVTLLSGGDRRDHHAGPRTAATVC